MQRGLAIVLPSEEKSSSWTSPNLPSPPQGEKQQPRLSFSLCLAARKGGGDKTSFQEGGTRYEPPKKVVLHSPSRTQRTNPASPSQDERERRPPNGSPHAADFLHQEAEVLALPLLGLHLPTGYSCGAVSPAHTPS